MDWPLNPRIQWHGPRNSFAVFWHSSRARQKKFAWSNGPNLSRIRSDGYYFVTDRKGEILHHLTAEIWFGGWFDGWPHFWLWIGDKMHDRIVWLLTITLWTTEKKMIFQTLLEYPINELLQIYPLTCSSYHISYDVVKPTLEEI